MSIHQRPKDIDLRDQIVQMEGDLVFHKHSQSANILTIVERKTRFAIFIKNENKKSTSIHYALNRAKNAYHWMKSITFDRGRIYWIS